MRARACVCEPMAPTATGEDQGVREGREAFSLCKEGRAARDGSDGRAGRTSYVPFQSRFLCICKKSVLIEKYNLLKPVKKQERNLSAHRRSKQLI